VRKSGFHGRREVLTLSTSQHVSVALKRRAAVPRDPPGDPDRVRKL
jgi:hypothetical protein